MISEVLDYENIVFIMAKIALASIRLCKDWKSIGGRKNKCVLKQKYGGLSFSNYSEMLHAGTPSECGR